VTAGAALEIQAASPVGAEALTLKQHRAFWPAAPCGYISGANTYGGAITLGSASRINSDAGTLPSAAMVTGAALP